MRYRINWANPYKAGGKLSLKGNLHTHSNRSDGKATPQEMAEHYKNKGYGFLAITDHGVVFDSKSIKTPGLLLLSGVEADFDHGKHTCVTTPLVKDIRYSRKIPQQKMLSANKDRCLVVLNHPDWQSVEHYTIDQLMAYKDFRAIEIYNSIIEILEGSALSTAKWDRLLGNGIRVLGLANQDAHKPEHFMDCCNVVFVKKETIGEVFKSLMTGNFYCYYGVTIKKLGREDNTVFVETKNAGEIWFIGRHGIVLKKVRGKKASMEFDDHNRTEYIRIECYGKGGEVSWSQPFFKSN